MSEADVATPEQEKELFDNPEKNAPDAVVFQKRFIQKIDRELALKLRGMNKRVFFDLSDAEWGYPERIEPLRQMMNAADVLTASTQYVANWMKKESGKEPVVIPDRIDLELHPLTKIHSDKEEAIVGWFGNRLTIEYLKDIEDSLLKTYEIIPFTLHVIWENETPYNIAGIPTKNITWDLKTINDELVKCDVIVSPHRADTIGRGKSNNKTIKAWALGLPCVGNKNLDLLPSFLKNRNLRYSEGIIGRNEVVSNYDVQQSVEVWRTILKQPK